VLDDSWLRWWEPGLNSTQLDPADRIDHVVVSRGKPILDSRHFIRSASADPAMLTDIRR
jgi:hypothetical protein